MKIGLVLPAVPAYSETFFVSKIRGLLAHGNQVVLFVLGSTTVKSFEGAAVCSLPKYDKGFSSVLSGIYSLIKLFLIQPKRVFLFLQLEQRAGSSLGLAFKRLVSNGPFLFHSLDWLHFGFGTMALDRETVAEAMGSKMAVSFRGFDIAIYPLKHPGCYERLWKKATKIHVISDDIADLVVHSGGEWLRQKCVKITPAIDIDFFSRKETKQMSQESIQLLTVARLHWKKGLDYTLEALAQVHQQGIPFHYTIIGEGPEEERLRFTAHQLGIADRVTFAGKQSSEAIKRQLSDTDLYLQYSIQEGFCNAVLEAQAMGVFCVVSDAEGLQENVVDGVTGFVVEKRKPGLLAEKIKTFLVIEEPKLNQVSLQAKERVGAEYNLDKQLNSFLCFYS